MNTHYLTGDATQLEGLGEKIIVHTCNDAEKWGKGFVLAVSARWSAPETAYRAAFKKDGKPALGNVQFIRVASDLTVANLIGQHGTVRRGTLPPIRYPAVAQGLARIAEYARELGASVHMPRIGCGLAGGVWTEIEPLIEQSLIKNSIRTFVYDLKP